MLVISITQELRKGALSRSVDVDALEKGVKQSMLAVDVSPTPKYM